MFLHLFRYRLRAMFREKEITFWIFLFPLCLATFFFLAFGEINSKTEDFSTIPVAVVKEDIPMEEPFMAMMDALADSSDGEAFFKPTYTTAKKAEKLLKNEKVQGIITLKDAVPTLTVLENSIESSMIKSVMDRYIQTMDIVSKAYTKPEAIQQILENANGTAAKIKNHKLTDGTIDNITDYYYSLIAMVCLFACFSGQVCATQMKANLTEVGKRKTIASPHRLSIIVADNLAAMVIHGAANAVLLIYLMFILKINIGVSFLAAWSVSLVGSFVGINIGALIGSIPKISENTRVGINVVFSLLSSFLSGLMLGGIKQVIEEHLPLLNRLNPATLISNSLYSLNIYETYDKFLMNLLTLGAMAIILCVISYFITRRESYDSL